MSSLWEKTALMPSFGTLEHDVRTDVLVIGGGIAGILCAYMLSQSGIDCVLVEAKTICSGITPNTTAKITSQHALIYSKLIRQFGTEMAEIYLHANQTALEQYRTLAKSIDCDFQNENAFTYSVDNRQKLEDELAALDKLQFNASLVEALPLPLKTVGAVCFSDQAQFNPLKFLAGIVPGLHIYEHTKVIELMPGMAKTDGGSIRADKIIAATHFPFLNKHGSYFLKMYQARSYVLALKGAADVHGMYVDDADSGLSFRNYGELLLLGGGGHRTGKKGGNWAALTDFQRANYPDSVEINRWATQDCMTLDGVPYIGKYSKNASGLYVATGFNKWGMTTAMAAAMLLRDMVQGIESPVAPLFSPSRSILRPQLAINGFEAVVNLLTPTAPRCPHLGCALKWNRDERSWDCPCHGSRFERGGELIDNPCTDDANFRRIKGSHE